MWIFKIIVSSLIFAAMLVLPSCSSDKGDSPVVPEPNPDTSLYLKLYLRSAENSSSRSNPSGGEEGDGREEAQGREDDINSLCLVFYNTQKENAINEEPETEITNILYFTFSELAAFRSSDDSFYLFPLGDYRPAEGDHLFVFANADNLPIKKGDKIGTLRDLCPARSFGGSTVKTATDFSMATARAEKMVNEMVDGKIYIKQNSSTPIAGIKDNPFYASVTIERTAARIDFFYENGQMADGGILYDVKGNWEPGETHDKVRITHILPVNMMEAPSYYFKRVTNSLTDIVSVRYCADEQPLVGIPANYVVEPRTALKSGAPGEDELDKWYGSSRDIFAFGTSGLTDDSGLFGESVTVTRLNEDGVTLKANSSGNTDDNGSWRSLILCYTNENTMFGADFQNSTPYMSGLAFRALYIPSKVYESVGADGTLTTEDLYTDFPHGTADIYRFSPSRTDGDWDASCDRYFSNESAVRAYYDAHPELNGLITKYTKGICYYNLWIRHANYDNGAVGVHFPMEYAIVRNNIYRISVTFSAPGKDNIDVRGPDNVDARIFVRKWNKKIHPEIIM